ncbi:unnamed protein product [Orchesella dallaii]|uniref:Uncharacterized protein n=1 Tax=Orchesella dallaii TaxID=48710 RepID=A0ABP1PYL7_9HEXA
MLGSLFAKQYRTRQPSIITRSSADTMSTATTSIVSKNTRNNKFKGKCDEVGDTHSHHSQSSADDESSLVSVKSGISKCCKQGSSALRKWQMFQMIILPFIPITALIVQNSTMLSNVVVNLEEAWEMKQQINTIVQIGKLLTELQQERAELGYCLFTNAPSVYTSTPHPSTIITAASSAVASHRFSDAVKSSSTASPASSTQHRNDDTRKWDNSKNSICRGSLTGRFEKTERVIHNLSIYISSHVPTVASLRYSKNAANTGLKFHTVFHVKHVS